jgi:hypothetical protein
MNCLTSYISYYPIQQIAQNLNEACISIISCSISVATVLSSKEATTSACRIPGGFCQRKLLQITAE